MDELLKFVDEHQGWLWALAAASVVIFLASLFLIPAVVVRIPADYFAHEKRPPSRWERQTPIVRLLLLVAKNVLGVMLIIAGIAMLALPGQGLLTIAVGFFLIDFPGKYRLECWLVSRRPVCKPLNWLRRRAGRNPLILRNQK